MNIVTKAAEAFGNFFTALGGVRFGVGASVLVSTCILFVLGFVALLLAWMRYGKDQDLLTFVKEIWKYVALGTLIGLSPMVFASLSGYVTGQAKSAMDTKGPIVDAGQGAVDQAIMATKAVWALRSVAQERLSQEWGVEETLATDNLDNYMKAQETMRADIRSKRKQVLADKAKATQDSQSSNPTVAAAGKAALQKATDQLTQLDQLDQQWKGADQGAKFKNGQLANGQFGADATWLTIGPAITGTVGRAVDEIKGWFVQIGSVFIIAIGLFLCGSAVMKILMGIISIFGRLLAYAVALTVAGAMAASLAPLAMVSFASQGWSRFGWNFIQFWLQAVTIASAGPSVIALVAKGLHAITTWAASISLALQSGALATSTLGDFAWIVNTGPLPMIAVGILAGQIPVVLDKGFSAIHGAISGHFQP